MSARTIALRAGISPAKLHTWTIGTLPTDFHAVDRLAQQLDCSLRWLLTGRSEPPQFDVPEKEKVVFSGYAKVKICELIPLSPLEQFFY